jgi:hypothetical protein
MRDPLPYHGDAIEYVRTHRQAFAGMDKRLGKTYIAYRWAMFHTTETMKVLVIAPRSAIIGWVDQLEEDGELVWDLSNPHNLKQWIKAEGRLPGRFFVIHPQGLFSPGKGGDPEPKLVAVYPWNAVILDEVVVIKNPKSQVNKIVHACLGHIELRCGLSGEYAPEGPQDVFEPMRWIFGSFMGHTNFWKWRNEFFNEFVHDWLPKKDTAATIKHTVMQRGYVLSRQAAGVGETFTQERRYCELPAKIKRFYDHAEVYYEVPASIVEAVDQSELEGRGLMDPMPETRSIRFTSYAPVVRNWLCQIAGGYPKEFKDLWSDHKLALLWEIVQERGREPLVVSFRHNAEIDAAQALLEKKGVSSVVLRGRLGTEELRRRAKLFQNGQAQIALLQMKVHFGLDLSRADTMIRYSLADAYNDLSQNRDRIIHPLKKRPYLYIDLVTKDTVDEDLALAAMTKPVEARFYMQKIVQNFNLRRQRKEREDARK